MIEENKNTAENNKANKNWLLVALVIIITVVLAIIIVLFLYGEETDKQTIVHEDIPKKTNKSTADEVVPTNAKDPEDFLKKIKEKSTEMQKNYDSNLTDFARKRWENLFKKQNGLESIDWQNSLRFLSQEIQKTPDGSTLFKVNYKIIQGGNEINKEDFYYLILSEDKKKEFDLSYLRPNAFISEEDILKNLNQENFVKIGKFAPGSNGE